MTSKRVKSTSVPGNSPKHFGVYFEKYIPLDKGNTMKNLSLKLDDIFQETEKIVAMNNYFISKTREQGWRIMT